MTSSSRAAVVDAWAALAFLFGEGPACAQMRRYLRRARASNLQLVISAVNLCEVYHRLVQKGGASLGAERFAQFRTLPVEVLFAREAVAVDAARIKLEHRVSLADAFAVATARSEDAPLLTGDPGILAIPRSVVRTVRLER